MKKLLVLTLSLASIGFVATSAEARNVGSSAASSATVAVNTSAPQWQRNRYDRRVRVVTRTRIVRFGRRVYRETYQIRYLPNGRTQTRLISRVRIR